MLWPDFGAEALEEAIASYRARERRFGRTSEQLAATPPAAQGRLEAAGAGRMLKTRVLTAIALLPLVLGMLFLAGRGAWVGFASAVALVSCWEWSRLCGFAPGGARRLPRGLGCDRRAALAAA